MQLLILWFYKLITVSIQLYFQQECEYRSIEEIKAPQNGRLSKLTGKSDVSFEDSVVIMLALMPHI